MDRTAGCSVARGWCLIGMALLMSACNTIDTTRPAETKAIATEGQYIPRQIRMVNPAYPVESIQNCQDGSVTVNFFIDSGGVPRDIQIVHSEPPDLFDDYVYVAVRRWRYAQPPADYQIDRRYQKKVNFHDTCALKQNQEANEDKIKIASSGKPGSRVCGSGSLTMTFVITETGETADIRISDSDMPVFYDALIMQMFRKMKWQQRIVDGVPVARKAKFKTSLPAEREGCLDFLGEIADQYKSQLRD